MCKGGRNHSVVTSECKLSAPLGGFSSSSSAVWGDRKGRGSQRSQPSSSSSSSARRINGNFCEWGRATTIERGGRRAVGLSPLGFRPLVAGGLGCKRRRRLPRKCLCFKVNILLLLLSPLFFHLPFCEGGGAREFLNGTLRGFCSYCRVVIGSRIILFRPPPFQILPLKDIPKVP